MMNILIVNCSPVRTGATDRICEIIEEETKNSNSIRRVCIDDYSINLCKGCRSCHTTAKCFMNDDVVKLMAQFEWADKIICVSPSYWADIPGQFKVFIDRCTPWCNSHNPHASISPGKKGYSIALRTGPNMPECKRIISSIEHFYGHLEITSVASLGLTSIEYRSDVETRMNEILDFCKAIMED